MTHAVNLSVLLMLPKQKGTSQLGVLSLLLNNYFNNRFDHSDNQILNATLSRNIRGLMTSETFTSKQITSICGIAGENRPSGAKSQK